MNYAHEHFDALDGRTVTIREAHPGRTLPTDAVVLASQFGGLSLATIAAREGLPLGTIKSRARLANARLREVMVGKRRQ
jgi:RNA polymerase sigma-70 factor, ECF subfamily